MKSPWFACALLLLGTAHVATAQNQALVLDGSGDYVELPTLPGLAESTVECWVQWDRRRYFSQPFAFGSGTAWQALGLNNFERTSTLQFFIYERRENLYMVKAPEFLQLGQSGRKTRTSPDNSTRCAFGVWPALRKRSVPAYTSG